MVEKLVVVEDIEHSQCAGQRYVLTRESWCAKSS